MQWLRRVVAVPALVALIVAACGPAPSPPPTVAPTAATSPAVASASPSASAAASPRDLAAGTGPLAPGTYTRSSFRPPIVFGVEDGWTAGTVSDDFFDVQQEAGTPDVIAVQFANVDGVAGSGRSIVPATTASAAASVIHDNTSLVVVDESASKMSGLDGFNVMVENQGTAPAVVVRFAAGALSIDPGRKLWISLFDTPDGLLAVMVGGSAALWERALTVAEPVLESVVIGGAPSGSPAAEPVRIALGGKGPIGIDIVGDRAWVILTDSGDLVEVDLIGQRVMRTIKVGTGGSQVVATDDSTVYVGRFDTGGVGQHIAVVDAESGGVGGMKVGPVGGLTAEGSSLWAFLKTGEVALIDRLTGRDMGSVTVHVDQDAHMDALAGAGSVWVSGDRTPVYRISGPQPHVVADIETGGGIPLVFAGDRVWGARPNELWAIDPATNTVVRRIPLEGVDEILALDIDIETDRAWIAARRPGRVGTVIALDMATGAEVGETPISPPAGVRLTADRAWVTDYDTDTLVGISRD